MQIRNTKQGTVENTRQEVISACPVCAKTTVTLFMDIPEVPTLCNALWPTREEAVGVARGTLQLGFCETCGHVYNYAFDPDLISYTQTYENSLHFSPRFQQYADALADRLIEKYNLRGKRIIEIGCGKGDFLRSICEKGENVGIGFDPSYEPDLLEEGPTGSVTVIRDLYSEQYTDYHADLICCRHVLEHIEDPCAFLRTVRQAVGDRFDTALFFEVPNVLFTLRDMAIWDLIYEHCSYFSPASLAYLFSNAGFDVQEVIEVFGGQYLCIEAFPSQNAVGRMPDEVAAINPLQPEVNAFAHRYRSKVQSWQEKFDAMRQAGQRAVIWGAGSKGITISNVLKLRDQIEYVVDINPRKQGMYFTGTGQCIVSPEVLPTYDPDVVIVMNAIYKEEIRQDLHKLGLAPELMIA